MKSRLGKLIFATLLAGGLSMAAEATPTKADSNATAPKAETAMKKAGKCGAGKCGGDMKKGDMAGKCGAGKCGGDMKKAEK